METKKELHHYSELAGLCVGFHFLLNGSFLDPKTPPAFREEIKSSLEAFQEVLNVVSNEQLKAAPTELTLQPLHSIFKDIVSNKSSRHSRLSHYSYATQKLCLNNILPGSPEESRPFEEALKELQEKARKEWEHVIEAVTDLAALTQTLYALLRKYGTRVGIGRTGEKSTLNLFEWIRTVISRMHCGKEHVLLLKGNLTGIQNFLYNNIQSDTPGQTVGLASDCVVDPFTFLS